MQAGIYRHYKGGYYQVLGIAGWSGNDTLPTNLQMVVYVSLTGSHMPGPRLRVRPAGEFLQNDIEQSDGTWAKRFEYIGDEIPLTNDIPLSGRPNPIES